MLDIDLSSSIQPHFILSESQRFLKEPQGGCVGVAVVAIGYETGLGIIKLDSEERVEATAAVVRASTATVLVLKEAPLSRHRPNHPYL